MRNALFVVFASALLTGTVLPSYAEGLLGGVLGGDGDNSLVTISSGEASESGLVNLGLGGGDSNLVDANVGGGLIDANASVGGGNGLIDANLGVLDGTIQVDANVGGSSLVGVGVAIGGANGGNGGGSNGDGTGGTGGIGTGGGSNAGNGGGSGGNGGGNNRIFTSSGSNSSSGAYCSGETPNTLAKLIRSTRVDASWMRASNVAIRPVMVCPEVKIWLSSQLAGSGLGAMLQNAVSSDQLISTSLSRSSYSPERVFAVKKSGSQLTVFVY